MSKLINFGQSARLELKKGLDLVADAVKITIGPRGRNVIVDKGFDYVIANDAGTIADSISLENKQQELGAKIIKSVIKNTTERVGGGRTAAAILTQALVSEGMKYIESGLNVNLLKKGINAGVKDVSLKLKKLSRQVKSKEEVKQVATISTESEEFGQVISDVLEEIGSDGIVNIESSQGFGITTNIEKGLKFERGYVSPYLITNVERMESEYRDVPILITDKKISYFKEIADLVKKMYESNQRELVIICEDFEGEALNVAIRNKLGGQFHILAVKIPAYGENKRFVLEDLSAAVGAKMSPTLIDSTLGMAQKVISTKDSTVIVGGSGDLQGHLELLKKQKDDTDDKMVKERYTERIAKLSNKVATIKVGAASEEEVKYLKLKLEDGVNEAKRALEEGIVIGGDLSFINARKSLKKKEGSDEESLGYNLVLKAIEFPFRQIVLNGHQNPDVILNKIQESDSITIGYDAEKEQIVPDMFEIGIIDALKVSRTVLENSASAASMFLTLEASITEYAKVD